MGPTRTRGVPMYITRQYIQGGICIKLIIGDSAPGGLALMLMTAAPIFSLYPGDFGLPTTEIILDYCVLMTDVMRDI